MIKVTFLLIMQTYLMGAPTSVFISHPTYESCMSQLSVLETSWPIKIESIKCEMIEEREA